MTQEERQKELKDFEKSLIGLSLTELEEVEAKVVAEADEIDAEVAKEEYPLAKENYKEVAAAIRMFLDKQTVEWQYTLGMVGMYDFWDPDKKPAKIPYPQLDSILRTLGTVRFTGYKEWAAVIVINKYFEPLHQNYQDATEKIYMVAAKHNAVLDQMKKIQPIGKVGNEEVLLS